MKRVTQADCPMLKEFLGAHAPIAMFPLSNLLQYGLDGDHPKAMRFWMNSPLTDVLGIAQQGIVQPVFTSHSVGGIAAALAGYDVTGVVGGAHGVAQVKRALALPKAALDRIEPHYQLDLSALQVPDVTGLQLVPYTLAPREVLIAWRTQYYIEALETPPSEAPALAMAQIEAALESGSHRVLMQGTTPLAVTGFNAQLPDTVMIGGVYTPPENRGRGYARKALALHLAEAHAKGIKRAVLSAANEAAAAAYEAIGFVKMGDFGITILDIAVKIDD